MHDDQVTTSRYGRRPEAFSTLHPDLLTERASCPSDGMHYTIEVKSLEHPIANWQRVEQSWELPEPLSEYDLVKAVARALALRADGKRAYRVVDPDGGPREGFWVQKCLHVVCERDPAVSQEVIPAGFESPMLYRIVREEEQRNNVYFLPVEGGPNEVAGE